MQIDAQNTKANTKKIKKAKRKHMNSSFISNGIWKGKKVASNKFKQQRQSFCFYLFGSKALYFTAQCLCICTYMYINFSNAYHIATISSCSLRIHNRTIKYNFAAAIFTK